MSQHITIEECRAFLATAIKYNIQGQYMALTDQADNLKSMKNQISELGKKVAEVKPVIKYDSVPQMIDEARKFFESLGDSYAPIVKTLSDPESHFKIQLKENVYSTGYTTMDENYKTEHLITVSPDAVGLMTLCQEMANAFAMKQARDEQRVQDEQQEHFIKETVNKFMSTMLIKYMTRNSRLSQEDKLILEYNSVKNIEKDTDCLLVDCALYKTILDCCPEIFNPLSNNLSPENFMQTLNTMMDTLPPEKVELITKRIHEISENGNSSKYIFGKVSSMVASLENAQQEENISVNKIIDSAENTHMRMTGGATQKEVEAQGNVVDDPNKKTSTYYIENGSHIIHNQINNTLGLTQEEIAEQERILMISMTPPTKKPTNY